MRDEIVASLEDLLRDGRLQMQRLVEHGPRLWVREMDAQCTMPVSYMSSLYASGIRCECSHPLRHHVLIPSHTLKAVITCRD